MKILLASDQPYHAQKIKSGLLQNNFAVDEAESLLNLGFAVRSSEYDAAIAASNSHDNLQEFCTSFRERGKATPILALADAFTAEQAIKLYEAGADDYASILSPVTIVVMRIKAMLRRGPTFHDKTIRLGDLELDCSNYTAKHGKQTVHLTKKEFGLLEYLLRHQNQVLSRTTLIEHVWDIGADLFSNSLETHILNLRRKIETPNRPKLIHTISGRGYKIAAEP